MVLLRAVGLGGGGLPDHAARGASPSRPRPSTAGIAASKRTGDLVLSTVNGAVKVDGHDGPLKVNTVNGSVEVSFAGAMRQASLETVNGSVTVTCATRLLDPLHAPDDERPDPVGVSGGHGRGQVGPEGGPRLDQRGAGEPRRRDRERRRPALRGRLFGRPQVSAPPAGRRPAEKGMVPWARLELARIAPHAPQTCASTNSATRARCAREGDFNRSLFRCGSRGKRAAGAVAGATGAPERGHGRRSGGTAAFAGAARLRLGEHRGPRPAPGSARW